METGSACVVFAEAHRHATEVPLTSIHFPVSVRFCCGNVLGMALEPIKNLGTNRKSC